MNDRILVGDSAEAKMVFIKQYTRQHVIGEVTAIYDSPVYGKTMAEVLVTVVVPYATLRQEEPV